MQWCSHRPETFSLNVLYIEQLNDLIVQKLFIFIQSQMAFLCLQ